MSDPIIVVDHDPRWAADFERLRVRLATCLGQVAVAIEHIGSTAVPGLAAKPVIDIDVVIASTAHLGAAIERLATIGYTHQGNLGIDGREAFTVPADTAAHHLYVCSTNAAELTRHLTFRDLLRSSPEVADAYGALKKRLALVHGEDRSAYTAAKSDFVRMSLDRAGGKSPADSAVSG